jgi:hypothetical protein
VAVLSGLEGLEGTGAFEGVPGGLVFGACPCMLLPETIRTNYVCETNYSTIKHPVLLNDMV